MFFYCSSFLPSSSAHALTLAMSRLSDEVKPRIFNLPPKTSVVIGFMFGCFFKIRVMYFFIASSRGSIDERNNATFFVFKVILFEKL